MLAVIVAVLALWIVLSIVGVLIEGVLWLTVLGGLLFLGDSLLRADQTQGGAADL